MQYLCTDSQCAPSQVLLISFLSAKQALCKCLASPTQVLVILDNTNTQTVITTEPEATVTSVPSHPTRISMMQKMIIFAKNA